MKQKIPEVIRDFRPGLSQRSSKTQTLLSLITRRGHDTVWAPSTSLFISITCASTCRQPGWPWHCKGSCSPKATMRPPPKLLRPFLTYRGLFEANWTHYSVCNERTSQRCISIRAASFVPFCLDNMYLCYKLYDMILQFCTKACL